MRMDRGRSPYAGRYSGPLSRSPSAADSRSPSPSYSAATPSRSPSRHRSGRSRRGSPSSTYSSRSPSPSSSSGNRTQRSRSQSLLDKGKNFLHDDNMKKSLFFLGAVGVAAVAANKYWPKGIMYGDKEEWEIEKQIKREKKKEKQEAQGGGGNQIQNPRNGDEPRHAGVRRPRGDDRIIATERRYMIDDGLRGRRDRLEVEDVRVLRRPTSGPGTYVRNSTNTVAATAGGSQASDARRARYIVEDRGYRGDRRSYIEDRERRYDVDRIYYDQDVRPAPQYIEHKVVRRRYSVDDESVPVQVQGSGMQYARRY